ncbi:hypothetical protein SK128_019701 [Halocaridina rubra]|uniref:Uncharacterized protein n=1 Tax=Halocaridina rubra TaxID=373956 RepID=A0AAN8WK67_HALRR
MSDAIFNTQFASEDDSRQRMCKVYLYRRPIVPIIVYHWSLYFEWDDYDATYEAEDKDGYLVYKCKRGKPDGKPDIEIGRIRLSPQEVNEKARRNIFSNSPYILAFSNCQAWVTELAKSLGLVIPIPINALLLFNPTLGIGLSIAHYLGLFRGLSSSSD